MLFLIPILDRAFAWLDVFGRQSGIDQAYLFGSLARPYRFIARSDMDLAVEAIDPERFFKRSRSCLGRSSGRWISLSYPNVCLPSVFVSRDIVWSSEI
jgi:hypothetical protein